MTDVVIVGIGQTSVGEHWHLSLRELAYHAVEAARLELEGLGGAEQAEGSGGGAAVVLLEGAEVGGGPRLVLLEGGAIVPGLCQVGVEQLVAGEPGEAAPEGRQLGLPALEVEAVLLVLLLELLELLGREPAAQGEAGAELFEPA